MCAQQNENKTKQNNFKSSVEESDQESLEVQNKAMAWLLRNARKHHQAQRRSEGKEMRFISTAAMDPKSFCDAQVSLHTSA